MIDATGRSKRGAEVHFGPAYALKTELALTGKARLLSVARSVAPDDMVRTQVPQPRALGLGHVVLCAKPLVGNNPLAVLLGDVPQPGRFDAVLHLGPTPRGSTPVKRRSSK